jgi:iron complex transport system ATP-binding protein
MKYRGQIRIDGASSLKGFNLAQQVTYFAQNHTITFPHTVFNTVLMGRRPHSPYYYKTEDKDLTKKYIDEMALGDFVERPINRLSGGELQKVFFARSLVQDTKYMLLDEPFNNLDPHYQIAIIKKLVQLKSEKSIVVVLHDIGWTRYFDDVIMLKEGHIMKNEINCDTLEQLYDIKFNKFNNGEDSVYVPVM